MNQLVAVFGPVMAVRWPSAVAEWVEAERGRFMPWVAVSMIAGVVGYFWGTEEPAWWLGLAGVGLFVAVVVAGWRVAWVRGLGMGGVALAVGFGSAQWAAGRASPMEVLPSRAVVVTALVRGVDVLPEGRRLVLEGVRLGDGPVLRRVVRVRMKRGDETEVVAGDRVEVRAVLRAPAPPAYPGGWDQQRDAWFSGVGGGGTALNPVVVLEHAGTLGVGGWVQGLRDGVARRAVAALPGTRGAVAATLLTGTTRAIPEADRAAFRDSGLAHLLAVAGLHIGIVMGLFLGGTRLTLAAWPHAALHWPVKGIAAGAALAAGGAYLVLTGGHVPILRSFAMACLVMLGIVVGRRAVSMRGLALAAMALVAVAPQEVVGVGFQMSFAAVLALIAGFEAMRPVFARLRVAGWGRTRLHVVSLVLTSVLAGTAAAPFGAYHFGHVQVYFVVANLVAVPVMAMWVLPLGILALGLMPFGLEGLAFAPMGWGLEVIVWVARTVASWPEATVAVRPMPGWGLAVFGLGLAWLGLWRTRVRLAGVGVMAVGLLSVWVTPLPDVLVSNEGRLIAWRGERGFGLQEVPGASRFVRDAWRDHLAVGSFLPLGDGCDAVTCRREGVLMLREGVRRAGCEGVRLVVSAEPAQGACPGAALLDRFTVWRDGAHAVWMRAEGPLVVSDRATRGARPWVPAAPVRGHRATTLPMAQSESLPADTVPGEAGVAE